MTVEGLKDLISGSNLFLKDPSGCCRENKVEKRQEQVKKQEAHLRELQLKNDSG